MGFKRTISAGALLPLQKVEGHLKYLKPAPTNAHQHIMGLDSYQMKKLEKLRFKKAMEKRNPGLRAKGQTTYNEAPMIMEKTEKPQQVIDIKRASEEVHAVLANSMTDRKTALLSMSGQHEDLEQPLAT